MQGNIERLAKLGYEIKEDSDQPGLWIWLKPSTNDGSAVSFASQLQAVEDAIADAISGGELSECQNCGAIHANENLNEIKHLSMRVAAGEPHPSGECPECGALCQPLIFSSADEKRFKKALEKATDAFWLAFANEFPEATTGDMNPGAVFAFDRAAEEATAHWLSMNVPADVFNK